MIGAFSRRYRRDHRDLGATAGAVRRHPGLASSRSVFDDVIHPDPVIHPFVARLPIGQRIPFPEDGIPGWEIFPFEGDIQVKVLEAPVLPEPRRHGEGGPQSCSGCQEPLRNAIWSDANWRLIHSGGPTGLPVTVLLCPLGHYDLFDLPQELSVLGPMLQQVGGPQAWADRGCNQRGVTAGASYGHARPAG
jgi:hypothetical protein